MSAPMALAGPHLPSKNAPAQTVSEQVVRQVNAFTIVLPTKHATVGAIEALQSALAQTYLAACKRGLCATKRLTKLWTQLQIRASYVC